MRTRSLIAVMVLLLAAGCGGTETAAPDTPATDASTTATEDVTSDVDGSSTSTSSSPPSSSTTVPTVTAVAGDDVAPWAVDLADPTGPRLDGWVSSTTRRPAPEAPPADVDATLTWIYTDLIELWRDDVRLRTMPMAEVVLEPSHRDAAPGPAIDVFGSAVALLADSYAVIADRAAAAQVTDERGQWLFQAWAAYATNWVTAAERIRDTLVEARSLPAEDQVCFLAVLDEEGECDGAGADLAAALLAAAEADSEAIDEVEIEELGILGSLGLPVDECAAWDQAASSTGLTDEGEMSIWLAIDSRELDVLFTARSECHWEREGIEDAEIDEDADRALLRDYLDAVVAAIVESGYDESVAELWNGAEDENREYESRSADATTVVVDVAREVASNTWALVDDPQLATVLYEVSALRLVDWAELGSYELAWDEVSVCDVWTEVLAPLQGDAATASALDAALWDLEIAGSLVPADCD